MNPSFTQEIFNGVRNLANPVPSRKATARASFHLGISPTLARRNVKAANEYDQFRTTHDRLASLFPRGLSQRRRARDDIDQAKHDQAWISDRFREGPLL